MESGAISFSDAVDIAQIIAMFAALAAVWYAERAVVETRALRREERVARLLDLVADLGEIGTRAAHGQAGENLLDVARLRLKAALGAAGESLPTCEFLLDLDWSSYIRQADAVEREAEAVAAVATALDEVSALLVRLRAEGASWLSRLCRRGSQRPA
jgi:hypothetical protein